jgi:hypothetical protein
MMTMGEQDGVDTRPAELFIVLQEPLRPLSVLVTGIDQHHRLTRVAHEVIIAATWVKCGTVIDMHDIHMG